MKQPLRLWLAGAYLCLSLPVASQAAETSPSREVLTNSIGMRLVRIPAGEFRMGSPAEDPDARSDEQPQHRVGITRPFHLGVYEVTQDEYLRVMGRNPSFFSPAGAGKDRVEGQPAGRFPVEDVSWHEAVAFCEKLSQFPAERKARRRYRLPTEAEWEYACRAGTNTPFHFGKSLGGKQANINGKYPSGGAAEGQFLVRTTEVGSYPPNEFGLYDMHGNVWEWCADWYAADSYRRSPANDPTGPAGGTSRVIRGGGWRSDARDCRSAFRYTDVPSGRFYVLGFRVAMNVGDEEAPAVAQTPREPSPRVENRTTTAAAAPAAQRGPDTAIGEEWPRWRGPRGDGTWKGPPLPDHWPEEGLRRVWRREIGGGYGGIAVADRRVYVVDRQSEPEERERILCFDADNGESLWAFPYSAAYGDLSYGNGPRSTPTIVGGRVYTQGAMGHLHCLDASTGQAIWMRHFVDDFDGRVPMWGYAASPVVWGDLVIGSPGGASGSSVVALDRKTGRDVWRSLSDEAGYATPMLIEYGERPQVVCWTPSHVRGLDSQTGKPLWAVEYEVTYGTSIAMPIFAEDIVFVSGYWEGARAIQLGPGATNARLLWQDNRNLRGLMSQPLYRDGYAYLLDKRHGLTCFELATGRKLWDDGNRMTPKGRNPQATMVWTGQQDRCLVLNSDGELLQVRPNPRAYEELCRTKIIGPTWAHPAYAGTCVYARSDEELVCVSLINGSGGR